MSKIKALSSKQVHLHQVADYRFENMALNSDLLLLTKQYILQTNISIIVSLPTI